MANPIWKDYFVALGDGEQYDYRIILADTSAVIYQGRCNRRPQETTCYIRINDICADYLQNVLPTLSQAEFTQLTMPVTFKVQILADNWTDKESVQFLYDWSYDYDYSAERDGLSFPIISRIDRRQWLTWTGYDVQQVDATIYLADGTQTHVIIPVAISADFNNDYNDDFSRSVRSAGSGTAVFNIAQFGEDVVKVSVGNITYDVTTECGKYALYYCNAYGGWDSLLVEGNYREQKKLTRYTRDNEYDNRDCKNRGKQNYTNELTTILTLNTGLLTDAESGRMEHLLSSTNVYLYDIPNDQMMPVILSPTSYEIKKYVNGRKFAQYAIEVQLAYNNVRR